MAMKMSMKFLLTLCILSDLAVAQFFSFDVPPHERADRDVSGPAADVDMGQNATAPEPGMFPMGEGLDNSTGPEQQQQQQQQPIQFEQASGASANGCPPLFGNNFPQQNRIQTNAAAGGQVQCQWIITSDRRGCPQFFQSCSPNPPMCSQQNEIWWQCTSECEPSCGNPSPNCRQNCGPSGCQCFPGFLRNQNGFCVNSNQCPGSDSCNSDGDCPGSSGICRDGRCTQGCASSSACPPSQQCSSGRCVARQQSCRRDSQCREPDTCIFGQCRDITTISCRRHFDCPGSGFCGSNGKCHDPFKSFPSQMRNFW